MRTRARTRRSSWLKMRLRRGRSKPAPTGLRLFNADSASAMPAHVANAWRLALKNAPGHCIAVAAPESSDVDVQAVADRLAPGAWKIIQFGARTSPESALAIAVRTGHSLNTAVLKVLLEPGIGPTAEGGGIRRRPILKARLRAGRGVRRWTLPWLILGHGHPERAANAREAFMQLLTATRGIRLGDFNLPRSAVLRWLAGRVHSAGVIAVVVPRWIPSTSTVIPASELGDTDHSGLDVTLWPER